MSKKIFLDMDGVVADFTAGTDRLYPETNLSQSKYQNLRGDEAWNILDRCDVSPQEFWGSMDKAFWAGLPKTHEADEIFKLCSYYVGRENICFLTSPCLTDGCSDGKREWAYTYFPGVPIILTMSACTKSGFPSYPPKSFMANPNGILIDDHTKNVREWNKLGGVGFLVPRPWNQCWPNENSLLSRMSDFLESVCQGVAV
jgi:hypothetical protein